MERSRRSSRSFLLLTTLATLVLAIGCPRPGLEQLGQAPVDRSVTVDFARSTAASPNGPRILGPPGPAVYRAYERIEDLRLDADGSLSPGIREIKVRPFRLDPVLRLDEAASTFGGGDGLAVQVYRGLATLSWTTPGGTQFRSISRIRLDYTYVPSGNPDLVAQLECADGPVTEGLGCVHFEVEMFNPFPQMRPTVIIQGRTFAEPLPPNQPDSWTMAGQDMMLHATQPQGVTFREPKLHALEPTLAPNTGWICLAAVVDQGSDVSVDSVFVQYRKENSDQDWTESPALMPDRRDGEVADTARFGPLLISALPPPGSRIEHRWVLYYSWMGNDTEAIMPGRADFLGDLELTLGLCDRLVASGTDPGASGAG